MTDTGAFAPITLTEVADRLEAAGLDPHALVVMRGERVVFEAAWAPYRLDQPALSYSASKTYTSLAIGFLVDEGRLGLDDPVGPLLGEPDRYGLTVRHLLTMNTGHTAQQLASLGLGSDVPGFLALRPEHDPGTFFAYNSPASHVLSAIVTAISEEPLTKYLSPRLFEPLGIPDRWMSTPPDGIEHGASGLHATAEDLARTAAMLGAGGRASGIQIVPAWYVEELSRPWSDTSAFDGPSALPGEVSEWARGYGYQVWRGRHGFRLDGAAGQFGLVLPEHDLSVGYQGSTLDTQAVLRILGDVVDIVDAGEVADAPPAPARELRDAWPERDRLTIMTEAPFDSKALSLVDAPEGWTLTLPGVGELAVEEAWREHVIVFDAEPGVPDRLALATRGGARTDGSVLVHVVSLTSPHRVIVRREADGTIHAGWHIPPLGGGWRDLRVPARVLRRDLR